MSALVGTQSGLVSVPYSLSDSFGTVATIIVEYSTDGGTTFHPATGGPGGEGTTGLSCSPSPGTGHTYIWNSLADGVGLGGAANSVEIRITPQNTSTGTQVTTSAFTIDNSAHTPPSATLVTPGGLQSGLVQISYSLIDAESDPCSITASFSVDAGATFAPATAGPGGDGLTLLASTPGPGTAHVFLWNSVADGVGPGGTATQVRIRLQPADGKTGAAASTNNFSVNNAAAGSGTSLGGFPAQVNSTVNSDWAMSASSDGVSLYTVGFEGFNLTSGSGADSSWRLEKRALATGALSGSFGISGAVSENPGPGLDIPFKVLVDGGFLFVVGAQETAQGSRLFNLRVEKRRVSDGSPVASFGSGGILAGSPIASVDGMPIPWTVAVDGCFIYLAGAAPVTATDTQWWIEKRDKLTGALVPSFGTAGVVKENPTATIDGCFGVVVDPFFLWLVGGDSLDAAAASNGRIRIEKRSIGDGSLSTGFNSGGVVTLNPGPGDNLAEDAVSDGTWLYVYSRVETGSSTGLFSRRIDARSLADGSAGAAPVTLTGTDPSGALPCHHLFLDGNAIMVCTPDGSLASAWRVERRKTSDLSLVSSFAGSGVLMIDPAPGGYHRPLDLLVAGGVVYVAGMASPSGDDRWRIEARWR